MSRTFIWNRNISGTVGKLPKGEFKKVTLARYWHPVETDIHRLLEHVGQGHPWSPGLFGAGNRNRAKANVTSAQAIALDIDDSLTVAKAMALPFVRQYAAAIYPSPSHQKLKHGVRCDRYRIVFILPEVVTSVGLYEQAVRLVMDQVAAADEACKDASRFFYGGDGSGLKPFLVNEKAELPPAILKQARLALAEERAEEERQKLEREQRRQQRQQQWRGVSDGSRITVIPLEVCISNREREDLQVGVPKGQGRSNRGFILSQSLLGARQWLIAEGYTPEGEPRDLILEWAARSGIGTQEAGKLCADWMSRKSPRPSLNDDALMACVRAYRWRSGDRSEDLRATFPRSESAAKVPPPRFKKNPYAIELRSNTPQRRGWISDLVPGIGKPMEVHKDDFAETVLWLAERGVDVLDARDLGEGKTYQAGEVIQNLPEEWQGVYVGQSYRNSLTPSLDAIPTMVAKHDGLVVEEVDGKVIQRRPRPGEKPEELTVSTCPSADAFAAGQQNGIVLHAGKDSPICQNCIRAQISLDEDGEVSHLTCPYLEERKATAEEPAYRSYPTSVASAPEGRQQLIFWDEAERLLETVQSREFSSRAIASERVGLEFKCRPLVGLKAEIPQILDPLFDAIQALLPRIAASPEHHFGMDPLELRRRLLPALEQVATQLMVAAESINGVDCLTPHAALRWLARQCDRLMAVNPVELFRSCSGPKEQLWTVENLASSRFLGDLIRALLSPETHRAIATISSQPNIETGEVTAKLAIARPRRIVNGARRINVFSDGTTTPWEIRHRTGRPMFWLTTPKPDYSNLTIKVVSRTASYCTNRTDTVRCGASELASKIQQKHPDESIGIIDYRRFHDDYLTIPNSKPLARWAESRGSNRLADDNVAITIGRPMSNLGSMSIEYTLATGQLVSPSRPTRHFRAWVERASGKELIQEAGRLRAQRSQEQKTLYVAGASHGTAKDLKRYFPTAKVEMVDVMQLAPQAAASKSLRTTNAVIDTTIELVKAAAETDAPAPTRAAVAEAAGVSLATVTRSVKSLCEGGFREFCKRSKTLLENLYSVLDLFTGDEELEALRQKLDEIGCGHKFGAVGAADTVRKVQALYAHHGQARWLKAMGALSPHGRDGIDRAIALVAMEAVTPPTVPIAEPTPPPGPPALNAPCDRPNPKPSLA